MLINSGMPTAVVEVLPKKQARRLLQAIQHILNIKKYPEPNLAKATAKHVVTLAETFTGEDDDCKALQAMAKCPKSDAERALQIILRKFDMTLNVPTTQKTFAGVQVPVLLPEDFIRTLSEKGYLHHLLGGSLQSRAFVALGSNLFLILMVHPKSKISSRPTRSDA